MLFPIPSYVQEAIRRKPPKLRNEGHLVLADSNLDKTGVFATAPFRAGDLLTLYPNDIVLWYTSGRSNGDTVRAFHRHGFPDIARVIQDYEADYRVYLREDIDLIAVPTLPTDDWRFWGHKVNDRTFGEDDDGSNNASFRASPNALWIVANRDIAPGEEITVRYKKT